jgi:tetratricopeptide (TPR) repeat protein
MSRSHKGVIWVLTLFAASSLFVQKVYGNIQAIDFLQVHYPAHLQVEIDFLKNNEQLYNHWSPNWNASIEKTEVITKLKALYSGIDSITTKNTEAWLLLGDLAHYLYNLDVQDYYDKAVAGYQQAQSITPKDYRGYWFIGNHYSLSAQPLQAIQAFRQAVQYLPPQPSFLFWNEYAGACMFAGMYGTARYAAHQVSILQGHTSKIETDIIKMSAKSMKPPPIDTTMQDKDVWNFQGRLGQNLILNSWVMGAQISVDSLWHLQLGGYDKHLSFAMIMPKKITSKKGVEIGYSFLVLIKVADENESLQQFLDKFTSASKINGRKSVSLSFSEANNGLAYETKDPTVYPDIGGAHGYAIAIQRNMPEFPGLRLERPAKMPKADTGKVNYYVAQQKNSRLNAKLYYLILFDSCEDIHDESLAVFNNFLSNLVIE